MNPVIVQSGRRFAASLAVALLCALALSGVARAANYTVTTTADANDGACTATLCSLRDAVMAADSAGGASTITVPAGTYTLSIASAGANDPATGDLDVMDPLTGPPTALTITGAGAAATTIDAAGIDRALAVDNGDASLTLTDVTVTGGQPSVMSSGSLDGGAVWGSGSLDLERDVFTHDGASNGSGGAVSQAQNAGALTVRNTVFTHNSAAFDGGAIANHGTGPMIISADTFGLEQAIGSYSDPNSAGNDGGALADSASSSASISHTTFSGNQANSGGVPGAGGGALALFGTSYALEGDEIDGNGSGAIGGAVLWAHGSVTGRDVSFAGNYAGAGGGGGIYSGSIQPLSLEDVTFSNNSANDGGGLYFAVATPIELVNDTFWDNAAANSGHGNAIYVGDTLTGWGQGVQNTAFAEPSGSGLVAPVCGNGSGASAFASGVDLGHNLSTDSSCLSSAPGDLPSTALTLLSPANNGGSVFTNAEPSGATTIDAGTNTVCPGLDARGQARPQGAVCDIGAYEFVPPATSATSTTATVTTTSTATSTTTVTTSSAPTLAPSQAPGASTRGTIAVQSTSAFLGGVVNPDGQTTTYSFQIGPTTTYGESTVSGHTDTGPLTVETRIAGLKPNTLYHYRMVATSAGGTGFGADRTFRTLPSYNGSLVLRGRALTVHAGSVAVRLACLSAKPCLVRFAITTPVRVAHAHKLGTLSFTRTNVPLVRIAAHRTVTVNAAVTPSALALLSRAARHMLPGTLSTRPRSNQRGIIAPVALLLR